MSRVSWTITTEAQPWQPGPELATGSMTSMPDVFVTAADERQEVEGFGAAFNELGWTALSALSAEQRDGILDELFTPGGGNFTMGRMPVGANDFSTDWYSYDEVEGDLALEHFSIEHDRDTLVPFIRSAQARQPDLAVWASPWSPPSWMKTNGHYAAAMPIPGSQTIENGLRPDQVGAEGTDMFLLDGPHLAAYAAYFGRFIDAYAAEGIRIGMVMPQNEFNSAQVFPSCTWTGEGLARFLSHLGPEMASRGVEVFLGTLERPNDALIEPSLADPAVAQYVKGVGLQWHGKGAAPYVHRNHPELRIYQTEQECGDGRNDWRFCRYSWSLMKRFFDNGANAYFYWNIALEAGGISRWGWAQNSLVTVDAAAQQFVFNHEYYLLKHVSHFVAPGARVIGTSSFSGFENQLAFRNPDGTIVIVIHNDLGAEQQVSIAIDGEFFAPTLPADSFSTFVLG